MTGMNRQRYVRVPTWATGLPTDPPYDADAFLYPPYWLAWCQQWPDGVPGSEMSEAMFAIAPTCLRRAVLSENAQRLLAVFDRYIATQPARLVFFSDMTATWARVGADWADFDVAWEKALEDTFSVAPGLHLTISRRAHALAAWPGISRLTLLDTKTQTTQDADPAERDLVRHSVLSMIAADWPGVAHRAMADLAAGAAGG